MLHLSRIINVGTAVGICYRNTFTVLVNAVPLCNTLKSKLQFYFGKCLILLIRKSGEVSQKKNWLKFSYPLQINTKNYGNSLKHIKDAEKNYVNVIENRFSEDSKSIWNRRNEI